MKRILFIVAMLAASDSTIAQNELAPDRARTMAAELAKHVGQDVNLYTVGANAWKVMKLVSVGDDYFCVRGDAYDEADRADLCGPLDSIRSFNPTQRLSIYMKVDFGNARMAKFFQSR